MFTHTLNIINSHIDNVFSNEKWQALFKGRVFKERHIGENNSLYAVDIYSEFDDKIVVMDYKTGYIDKQRLSEYGNQLKNYASILKKVYDKKVETYIYHIETGEIKSTV